jgi:Rieske Fe-S protein
MRRKEFIQTCGLACIGGGLISGFLQSCSPSKIVSGNIEGDQLVIPLKYFKSKSPSTNNYVIIRNPKLQFPICVYELAQNNYSALLMQCTHKGAELQVFGNKLQCPAHGSEFANTGKVTHGPAEKNLRNLTVTIQDELLKISLK